jgi:GNAT superfamily N-acetyltransferase
MLEIMELDESIEKDFWSFILSDIPRYFFFILDLKQYPEKCKFLIARESEMIVGLCIIWRNHIAQIRSQDPEVIEALYNAIPKDTIDEITFEYPHQDLLRKLVPNPLKEIAMHRMIIDKQRMILNREKMIPWYKLDKPYIERRLGSDDADQIQQLMRSSDPVFWGDWSVDHLDFGENQIYTGLFDGDKLISYTLAWVDETAAILATVATHPDYQNQGLATYLVNEGVHTLLEHSDIGLIHVRVDNPPAIRVYKKVGYEVYQTYLNVKLK